MLFNKRDPTKYKNILKNREKYKSRKIKKTPKVEKKENKETFHKKETRNTIENEIKESIASIKNAKSEDVEDNKKDNIFAEIAALPKPRNNNQAGCL